MAIFYTDSGSFNDVSVTGSSLFSGSVIISGSAQSVGGGFTGSFTGSHTGTFPYSGLTSVPSGIVSSSGQVATLLPAGTYSSSTQLPSGTVSSSTQIATNLPNGTVSSSGQVSYTGLSSIPNGIVSASTQFTSLTAPFTGSFTGSHTGTFPYASLTGIPNGIVSSSGQISYTGLSNIPNAIVSSSGQVAALLPAGTYSSSTQLPSGIISSSTQVAANLPNGVVSSSGQVSYTGLSNIPNAIVSSSTQFTNLTAPFTGSFTGSFIGTHSGSTFGTASWAQRAVSSSFATTASAATSITFTPSTSSFATTASAATSITFTPSTASFASTASFVNTLNQSVSASGDIAAGTNLVSNYSAGDEGGEIQLSRPQTNTSISGSIVIDVNTNRVRIFESNLPNRGGYWDITSLASGVGTNLAGGAGTVTQVNTGLGLSGGPITGTGTITLDTSSVHFLDGVKKELNTEGVISSSAQVSYTGISNIPVGIVSSSAQFRTITNPFTGSFTGSFAGTHTGTFPYASLTGTPTGIVSSSTQVTSLLPTGTVSSSGQVSYTGLSNVPTGIVSSSTQFKTITDPFTGSFTGSHTGTFPYASLTGTPTGIVSSSTQVTSLLPAGTVSSSGQVSYTGLSNIPNGIVSSSTQFTSLTAPFTGSFTGSFRGSLTGTSSWANNVVSSSFATTASFATSASWAPGGAGLSGGTANYIPLWTSATAQSSSNIFQSNGNIGIGTTTPPAANLLTVSGSISASNGLYIRSGSTIFLQNSAGTKQVAGGPEKISVQSTVANEVTIWSGLSTDTEARYLLSVNGFTEWGQGGASDQDIALFRNGVGSLAVQSFNTSSANTFQVLTSQSVEVLGVDTRAGSRRVRVNGAAGGATLDLKGDSGITAFRIEHASAGDIGFSSFVTGDGFIRFYFAPNGDMYWGSGTAAADIYLRRSSTRNLAVQPIGGDTTTTFRVLNSAGSDVFAVDTSNNRVGIGTTSPANTLQVAGNISASSYTSSIAGAAGFFGTASYAVSASWAPGGGPGGTVGPGTANSIALFDTTNTVSSSNIFQSSNNIGIGVSTPATTLQIQGAVSASSYTSSVAGSVGYFGTSSWATTSSLALNIPIGTILTASIGSGSLFNILEMSMAVSGTIAAVAGNTVTLDLNKANYFAVSASAAGTVTWAVTNAPAAGRAQTFVIEYTNGGAVTNTWFTGTRWPGGTAPTLTSGSNPDVLGFVTDDAGTNWRGVLLQRNSS